MTGSEESVIVSGKRGRIAGFVGEPSGVVDSIVGPVVVPSFRVKVTKEKANSLLWFGPHFSKS